MRSVPLCYIFIHPYVKTNIFHTFSAFWLWSSVVSVLISMTTDMFRHRSELLMSRNFFWWCHFRSLLRVVIGVIPVLHFCWNGVTNPTTGRKWENERLWMKSLSHLMQRITWTLYFNRSCSHPTSTWMYSIRSVFLATDSGNTTIQESCVVPWTCEKYGVQTAKTVWGSPVL